MEKWAFSHPLGLPSDRSAVRIIDSFKAFLRGYLSDYFGSLERIY